MPAVLKMARHINHANWLFRALFHSAINFHTPSQIATRTIRIIKAPVLRVILDLGCLIG